jgi:hypothetical protein
MLGEAERGVRTFIEAAKGLSECENGEYQAGVVALINNKADGIQASVQEKFQAQIAQVIGVSMCNNVVCVSASVCLCLYMYVCL